MQRQKNPKKIKIKKAKEIFADNRFHNILRLFDILPNFPFITSETMHDYYLQTWYIRVASRVAERLKKLGNMRKVSKLHTMIA